MDPAQKIDDTDLKIIDMLKKNARLQWREIGDEIHLTGQAVGQRVKQLMDKGIITGFHASTDDSSSKDKYIAYVTVIMTTSDHQGFVNLVKNIEEITELYRISGNGCYMMKLTCCDQDEVNHILEQLLQYANYSINTIVKRLK